jgi:hypothetical protein
MPKRSGRRDAMLEGGGLGLALLAEVAREAIAEAGGVDAHATAGAVAALDVAVAAERVLQRAVRAAVPRVALVPVVRVVGVVKRRTVSDRLLSHEISSSRFDLHHQRFTTS